MEVAEEANPESRTQRTDREFIESEIRKDGDFDMKQRKCGK